MRPFHAFLLILLSLRGPLVSVAQQTGVDFSGERFDPQSSRLLARYLNEPDSATQRIVALMAGADQSLSKKDNLAVLNQLTMALIIEANTGSSDDISLQLNKRLGAVLCEMNPRHALIHLKKAMELSRKRANNLAVQGRFQMMGTIAGLHHLLAEPDSALHWDRMALKEASLFLDNIAEASALNNLGVHFAKYQRYDSAVQYYHLALQALGNMENNRVLYCSIQDNVAQERERQGDFAYAYAIYRFNDSVFLQREKWHRVVPNRIRLLNAAQKLGLPEFRQQFEKLARFVEEYRGYVHIRDQLAFYRFAKDYYLRAGPLESALRYDQWYTQVKDTLDEQAKKQADLMAAAFSTVQTIRFQRDAELHRLESRSAKQALRFTWALVAAGIAGIMLLVLLMRRRKRELDLAYRLTMAELHAKDLEAQAMTQALEIQKSDITAMALHNTQVLDLQRHTIQRLSDILQQKKNTQEALNRFIVELQVQEQLGDRARLVLDNIERANAEFYQALSSRYPGLSKAETELCGYLRINLSSKDIALLKNIAPASVKMSKNRLRKKMGLDPEADLYTFIQAI